MSDGLSRSLLPAFLLLPLLSGPGWADEALDLGAAVFEPCRSCHALEPTAQALPGPTLAGLIGRPVAGDPAYDYSPVLRAAGDAGLVWDKDRLLRFLEDPEGMFPGMWMSYPGLELAEERVALASFIARVGPGDRPAASPGDGRGSRIPR